MIEDIAQAIASCSGLVVVTGAGVSAESQIPTFRDSMTGLWAQFDPQILATPEAFAADPETVTRWYDHRRLGCLAAEPNPGHAALAELERWVGARGGSFTLLTQNVDGLHARAGSQRVVELHGSIARWRCCSTGREFDPGPDAFDAFPPASPFEPGAIARPCVVWFGEALPTEALDAAERALETCDLFMSIGTSSVVWPAAGFVHAASARGAPTVEINPEPTEISGHVTWSLRARSGEALPGIIERLPR